MKTLLLITGAGASYDVVCTSKIMVPERLRPPLTKDLFKGSRPALGQETPYSVECLQKHPQAYQAGYDYYNRLKKNDAEISLEKYLLGLKNGNKSMRAKYWAVPLYLFDLFYEISQKYLPTKTGMPSNYRSLIDALDESHYEKVLWLNLNYDLLADQAIKSVTQNRLASFEDYMNLTTADGLKIKYTKPHGSIDWYRGLKDEIRLDGQISEGACPEDFEQRLYDGILKAKVNNHSAIEKPFSWYPAITAPVGEYEFVYPKHIDDMEEDLKQVEAILCIGFSALDKDVLDLIQNKLPRIKKIMMVNGTREAGESALDRLGYLPNISFAKVDAVFKGGFTQFVENGISDWLK